MAVIWGVISTTGMAINLLPDISFPYLSVQTVYAGANAETVDKDVTQPLENALSQITGIHEISTYSLDNASIILLQFDYGTDTDKKQTEMQEKIAEVTLPEGCQTSKISSIDLNATSIYSLTVFAKDGSMDSVYEEANRLKSSLSAAVDGVKLVLGSLIGSTLTSVCVFFPILFINGLTKEIFADLSWAVIFSLSFSLLVAVTVIPTLFCFFYREKTDKKESGEQVLVPECPTTDQDDAVMYRIKFKSE